MKQLLRNLLLAVMSILGIIVCWQGMNELYKFHECDYTSLSFSFFIALIVFYQVFNILSMKRDGGN
jgi:hypothetical protein